MDCLHREDSRRSDCGLARFQNWKGGAKAEREGMLRWAQRGDKKQVSSIRRHPRVMRGLILAFESRLHRKASPAFLNWPFLRKTFASHLDGICDVEHPP